ncbi:MAG: c-type cytochrome [Deltaproteobacteria bacterium]|nr:c-type cytochrome [Deltaproteobacteria bacterium]
MRITPALALLLLFGCSDPPTPTEVWRPSDHAQPPRQSVDPSRVPRQPQPEQPAERPEPQDRAAAAQTLWRISCSGCHGVEGRGDGNAYDGELADFTSAEWQASVTDEAIARAITLGAPPMPAFGEILAPAGIAALVEHVRRLGGAGPDGGSDSETPTTDAETPTADSETPTADSETPTADSE